MACTTFYHLETGEMRANCYNICHDSTQVLDIKVTDEFSSMSIFMTLDQMAKLSDILKEYVDSKKHEEHITDKDD